MSANVSLAAQYRPQTFAEVVGQDMVKSILSRAAREDRVAPAYLLSGTRGVGKTTIARIFAKALNCEHAPTGEPCNQCDACRRITQGSFVDVVEIDGASNRGIDDIRRLRDAVGYAPLEGRYKVFIIDEAHMLTKEAFNALLKTLEEPPSHVTFILATTEQHKFPVTIVSRCQHFVFRQIPESTLEEHICDVLRTEGRPFEREAARLIARRAAGSVRDSMSLLGQVLALGSVPTEPLTAKQVREVLGLAGSEIMDRLLDVLARHDASGVTALVEELLTQGTDMGFFLRELGSLWRSLFLIRQAGDGAADNMELSPSERERMTSAASRFSLTYIHAAWQMTLDSQRRILTSLEPSSGLELLLLNLAFLPRLLPLEELGALPQSDVPPFSAPSVFSAAEEVRKPGAVPQQKVENAEGCSVAEKTSKPVFSAVSEPAERGRDVSSTVHPVSLERAEIPPRKNEVRSAVEAEEAGQTEASSSQKKTDESWSRLSADTAWVWDNFLAFCKGRTDIPIPVLRQCAGEVRGNWLVLQPLSQIVRQQLQRPEKLRVLEKLSAEWVGKTLTVVFCPPQKVVHTEAEIRENLQEHPVIKKLRDAYDATLTHCTPLEN